MELPKWTAPRSQDNILKSHVRGDLSMNHNLSSNKTVSQAKKTAEYHIGVESDLVLER